jgi:hypothetical protein
MLYLKNLRWQFVLPVLALFFAATLVSWDKKKKTCASEPTGHYVNDTLPPGESREKKIRNLDEALEELNKAEWKLEQKNIQREIAEALKKIDHDKIKREVDKAIREIDFDKISREIENSIAKIDWDKMQADLDRVKEVDMSKLETEMKKMEEELKKIGPEIAESMKKAKVEIKEAKLELKGYRNLVKGLENDGLLNTTEDYSLFHKNGKLFVNDKKVSPAIYKKYRTFLEKHKNFTIQKTGDDLDIDKE